MEDIFKFIDLYNTEIIIGMGVAIIILFISFIINKIITNKKLKKYKEKVDLTTNAKLLEDITNINRQIVNLQEEGLRINKRIEDLDGELKFALTNIGFIRYNAFENAGRELSYSIALLDREYDGFILTSIYSNGESIAYAKDVKNGESKIPLSEEEKEALEEACNG